MHPGLRTELLYRRFLSRKTVDAYDCSVFMNLETGIQIGNKSLILTNLSFICDIIIAAFIFNAMQMNAIF